MALGYYPVLVQRAEIPVPELAGAPYFFKIAVKLVYAVSVPPAQKYGAFYKRGRLVGYNIIDTKPCRVKPLCALRHFKGRRLLLAPPVARGYAHILIVTLAAAESEKAVALNFKNLPAHKVYKVALYSVHHSAVPVGHARFVYGGKVIVCAVYKRGYKPPCRKVVYHLLFGFSAVEYIAEITANYKHVSAF